MIGVKAPTGLKVELAGSRHIARLSDELGPHHHAYFTAQPLVDAAGERVGEVLVAVLEDRIVGAVFVHWGAAEEQVVNDLLPDVPQLYHFEVHEDFRCRGIGTRLLVEAESLLRSRRFKSVLLGVDRSNQRARQLYERLGFVEPHQEGLRGLRVPPGDGGLDHSEPYDILVADLYR